MQIKILHDNKIYFSCDIEESNPTSIVFYNPLDDEDFHVFLRHDLVPFHPYQLPKLVIRDTVYLRINHLCEYE